MIDPSLILVRLTDSNKLLDLRFGLHLGSFVTGVEDRYSGGEIVTVSRVITLAPHGRWRKELHLTSFDHSWPSNSIS